MAKVGRFVTDPKAGSYCRITLDSGNRILVSHGKGRGGAGAVTIEEVRWWGFVPGATVFACDSRVPEVSAREPASSRARPQAARGQRHWAPWSSTSSVAGPRGEVTAACEALVSSGPQLAA